MIKSNHFTSDFDLTVDHRAPDKPSENELEVSSGVARFEPDCELANLKICDVLLLGLFVA